MSRNYWCFRTDTRNSEFFWKEMMEGRLRQGWGYHEGQNLRNFTYNEGASLNFGMYKKVKKGDIILLPNLPDRSHVAIAEATEDWDKGYDFNIPSTHGDYGHIFPAKYLKRFVRHSALVDGKIRATLKNVRRFWNVTNLHENIDKILLADEDTLVKVQDSESRFISTVESVYDSNFNEDNFAENLYTKITTEFSNEEWENALIYGLRQLYPFYEINRVGGSSEIHHGTDILIMMPSISPYYKYAVAVQVKDWENVVGNGVVDQVNKSIFFENEKVKLIDKIVIVTRANKEDNINLDGNPEINFIFAGQLKEVLLQISKKIIYK